MFQGLDVYLDHYIEENTTGKRNVSISVWIYVCVDSHSKLMALAIAHRPKHPA